MRYFIDTEFIEGKQDKTFLGIKYGETKPSIDLISIGIVSEEYQDNIPYGKDVQTLKDSIKQKEYYAISKDFNLKAAWKNEWVRENVLKQIYSELVVKANDRIKQLSLTMEVLTNEFNYKGLKVLLDLYGKTNKQITKEIIEFIDYKGRYTLKHSNKRISQFEEKHSDDFDELHDEAILRNTTNDGWCVRDNTTANPIEFYGYYSDYDWVVFCNTIAEIYKRNKKDNSTGMSYIMPAGFPYYCKDLKQELDRKVVISFKEDYHWASDTEQRLQDIQNKINYPKQTNEHNALADAKWNYKLYKFLNTL